MSESHDSGGGNTEEAFQEQCFLCERGTCWCRLWAFLTQKIFYMYKNSKKHNGSLKFHTVETVVFKIICKMICRCGFSLSDDISNSGREVLVSGVMCVL